MSDIHSTAGKKKGRQHKRRRCLELTFFFFVSENLRWRDRFSFSLGFGIFHPQLPAEESKKKNMKEEREETKKKNEMPREKKGKRMKEEGGLADAAWMLWLAIRLAEIVTVRISLRPLAPFFFLRFFQSPWLFLSHCHLHIGVALSWRRTQ
jgi:hypothetical protein